MFLDIVNIDVKAGDGGDGAISFRREKYVSKGGPDGGDGGRGGDIILVGNEKLCSLRYIREGQLFEASKGGDGGGKKMHGSDGNSVIISVPLCTKAWDVRTEKLIGEIDSEGEKIIVARGGRGGKGNIHFATSVQRSPTISKKGGVGEKRKIRLEFYLKADVGIIGLPNSGKSTLLASLSGAKPKIASYPFTTVTPNLGVVKNRVGKSFSMIDTPALVSGSCEGKGIGASFLRHLEKTKIIIFLLDALSQKPEEDFFVLSKELEKYNPALVLKKKLIVLNKIDLLKDKKKKLWGKGSFFSVSALVGIGLNILVKSLFKSLDDYCNG